MRHMIKFFKRFLQKFNIEIRRILWKRDKDFDSLYSQIYGRTVVSPDRIMFCTNSRSMP